MAWGDDVLKLSVPDAADAYAAAGEVLQRHLRHKTNLRKFLKVFFSYFPPDELNHSSVRTICIFKKFSFENKIFRKSLDK